MCKKLLDILTHIRYQKVISKSIIKRILKEVLPFSTVHVCNCLRTSKGCGKFKKSDTTNLRASYGEVGLNPHAHSCCMEQREGTGLALFMALSTRIFGQWWKSQIIPVKKQTTMWLGALFPCFKGICSLIKYRKQLVTCWWEPMEKNTLSINCVFLILWLRLQGVGIGSILGTAALR